MKIAYIEDGKGLHDIRFVGADYAPQLNETIVEGDDLSAIQPYRMVGYAEMRTKEYLPIGETLDALSKMYSTDPAVQEVGRQQMTNISDHNMAVKSKYPKTQSWRL